VKNSAPHEDEPLDADNFPPLPSDDEDDEPQNPGVQDCRGLWPRRRPDLRRPIMYAQRSINTTSNAYLDVQSCPVLVCSSVERKTMIIYLRKCKNCHISCLIYYIIIFFMFNFLLNDVHVKRKTLNAFFGQPRSFAHPKPYIQNDRHDDIYNPVPFVF
jgi:hypothetical protein